LPKSKKLLFTSVKEQLERSTASNSKQQQATASNSKQQQATASKNNRVRIILL